MRQQAEAISAVGEAKREQMLKKIKLFPGDQVLVLAAAVGIAALIALRLSGAAVMAEASGLDKEIAGVRRELASAGGIADVSALKKTLEEAKARSVAFPTEQEGAGTLGRIWVWAEAAGVQLDQVKYSLVGDVVDGWSYPAHQFSLSGKGKSAPVVRFLESIEKSGMRTLTIGNVGLSAGDGEEWRFSLVVKVWSAGKPVEQPKK